MPRISERLPCPTSITLADFAVGRLIDPRVEHISPDSTDYACQPVTSAKEARLMSETISEIVQEYGSEFQPNMWMMKQSVVNAPVLASGILEVIARKVESHQYAGTYTQLSSATADGRFRYDTSIYCASDAMPTKFLQIFERVPVQNKHNMNEKRSMRWRYLPDQTCQETPVTIGEMAVAYNAVYAMHAAGIVRDGNAAPRSTIFAPLVNLTATQEYVALSRLGLPMARVVS